MTLLRRWQARHLLLAWAVYWLALVLVGLRPAFAVIWRAINAPKGLGAISAGVTDGVANLTVKSSAQVWSGSMSLTTLVLWFAGPPLVLWLVWFATRRAPVHEAERDYRIS